ncbi:MAG TPA: ThiF family adenylyltransferase [Acidimicrobiales bacterium]
MRRPRVKPEHAPYRIGGARIRIGGATLGIAAEVEDPTGAVWTLLTTMDGTRGADQIVQDVVKRHPEMSGATVRIGMDELIQLGHVEDVADEDPCELTDRDMKRYDRSRRWFRWVDPVPRTSSWVPQVRLLQAKVTIVGMGGTGGTAALALAASGVGRLHCVDPDVVELSNLNRQVLYNEDDLGRPKVDAAVARLRRLNTDITITSACRRVAGIAEIAGLADDCDALVLAADEPPELRIWTNRACLATRTPWVDGGYNGPLVGVGLFVPGMGACFECLLKTENERRRALGIRSDDAPDWSTAVAQAVAAPSAGIAGYLVAHAVLAQITGAPLLPAGRRYEVNLVALDHPGLLDTAARPDCPACGGEGSPGPQGE